jgi:hypothetical protein
MRVGCFCNESFKFSIYPSGIIIRHYCQPTKIMSDPYIPFLPSSFPPSYYRCR